MENQNTPNIQSSALAANLSKTNKEYTIPDDHLWFLALSEKYWGIHKRTENFFSELNHPFTNRKEVTNLLGYIAINDFWIYKELKEDDKERAISIILSIFEKLLQEQLPDQISKHLICICLDFLATNYDAIKNSYTHLNEYINLIINNLDGNFFSYLSNIGYFKTHFEKAVSDPCIGKQATAFMKLLAHKNIDYWDSTTQIERWYAENRAKMSRDYSASIQELGSKLFQHYREKVETAATWNDICDSLFTFSDIIDTFRQQIDNFDKTTEQFAYIFYLLHLPGTVYHRNYLIIELNNVIKRISHELDENQSIQSINELFVLFADFKISHQNLILDSVLALGKEIINTGNKKLIHHFENQVISFGFITPGIAYLTEDWELKVNPCHVKNIRVWCELIEYSPETMKTLLSALIINLRLGGVFIFDTDFFQKDITKLLNSNVAPIYKQIKQLSRIFPVYFNEIGAEGQLRDVSTKLDEMSHRDDKLIHFLRKQIHTEGNNSHIQITLEVIKFWYDLNKKRLVDIVPKNVFEQVYVDGKWVKGVHEVLHKICKKHHCALETLLRKDKKAVEALTQDIEHDNEQDILRVRLIIELYQLLKEKYVFETTDLSAILRRYHFIDSADIESLETLLNGNDDVATLKLIYSIMVKLNNLIFDPKPSEGWENVFYKRHIAFGIPSMYGYYREVKFDALGLTFRFERLASVLVERIIGGINTDYFTAKTLREICSVIQLLQEGLRLDGIYDQGFDSNLKMLQYSLTSGSFTIRQYINIFQFMENSLKEIINKYFIRPYESLLYTIIPQHLENADKLSPTALKKTIVKKSEIFYRELIFSAFIIQNLDNFIGNILNNLRKQVNMLTDSEIQNVMSYNPELVISPLYAETPILDNQVFLGSKAYYLKKLYLKEYSVPPGFVLTTEVFRRMNSILKIPTLNNEIDTLIKRHIAEIERISGLRFGDYKKPLLLSVRSGAAISMPGAMNTFLNVGLNDEITENLSKQDNFGWTSWDCYRRLLQTWGMSYGLERNAFDQIMLNYKEKYNVSQKIDFTPAMMKEIAFAYKQLLIDNNIHFEEEPFAQIKQAIISVFSSWDTPRAIVYRDHMQIADEWGTAVIVQQMIFGNLHKESGSGVLFTHDVQDNDSVINLTGDFSFLSQGEDIVAGLINTLPISENQRIKYYHKSPFSLESAFPEIYNKLKNIARQLLEKDGFGHQEIEFTFETAKSEDLFILQTRDMVLRKNRPQEIVFDVPETEMKRVGGGIGIGNKVLNGAIVFDLEDINTLKERQPDTPAVLIRPDTVPDDIEIIFECEGLLTGRGGSTSHAAVTAAALGKTCVVNCDDMVVYENEKKCIINNCTFRLFDLIAIDGINGIIYEGNYPIRKQEL